MEILEFLKNALWGGPLLFLLVGVGVYQTWVLQGLQFRHFFHGLKLLVLGQDKYEPISEHEKNGELSAFQSLMTSLAGAVGTGNITGVAIALSLGGYGALFWMWVIALFGMITAYSEAVLAVRFRQKGENGTVIGGPMQTLLHGLQMKKSALAFAIFCIISSFGIGATIQSNSVAAGLQESFGIAPYWTGLVMAFITACVVLGGVKSIGKAASVLVPFMAISYLGAGILVLMVHVESLIPALLLIVRSAFTGHAAVGGFLGATFVTAIQHGVSIGIFANEAGLGSLAIAASTARTKHAARQGFLAISGVFISTMVICTMTGMVIAVTDVLSQGSQGAQLTGSALTIAAFSQVRPEFGLVVVFGLVFFAFTSVLAWACYGEKTVEFLWGAKPAKIYRYLYTVAVFLGTLIEPHSVWVFANLANGLMAIPNLFSIVRLSSVVKEETQLYLTYLRSRGDKEISKVEVLQN